MEKICAESPHLYSHMHSDMSRFYRRTVLCLDFICVCVRVCVCVCFTSASLCVLGLGILCLVYFLLVIVWLSVPLQCRKLSQPWRHNTSQANVHFHIGVPPQNIYSFYIFASIMLMSLVFSINVTGEYVIWITILTVGHLCENVHGFLLLLLPLDCPNFCCYVIGQWRIQL